MPDEPLRAGAARAGVREPVGPASSSAVGESSVARSDGDGAGRAAAWAAIRSWRRRSSGSRGTSVRFHSLGEFWRGPPGGRAPAARRQRRSAAASTRPGGPPDTPSGREPSTVAGRTACCTTGLEPAVARGESSTRRVGELVPLDITFPALLRFAGRDPRPGRRERALGETRIVSNSGRWRGSPLRRPDVDERAVPVRRSSIWPACRRLPATARAPSPGAAHPHRQGVDEAADHRFHAWGVGGRPENVVPKTTSPRRCSGRGAAPRLRGSACERQPVAPGVSLQPGGQRRGQNGFDLRVDSG